MKELILLLICLPCLLWAQQSAEDRHMAIYINPGQLASGGIELGIESALNANIDLRSAAKYNYYITDDLMRDHLYYQQQLLIYRSELKRGFYYGPTAQIGQSYYNRFETDEYGYYGSSLDFLHSFFFGVGAHTGLAWQVSNHFKLNVGLGANINYLKYHTNRDNVYGEFSPEILDNGFGMLSRHWELMPELTISVAYSWHFPEK